MREIPLSNPKNEHETIRKTRPYQLQITLYQAKLSQKARNVFLSLSQGWKLIKEHQQCVLSGFILFVFFSSSEITERSRRTEQRNQYLHAYFPISKLFLHENIISFRFRFPKQNVFLNFCLRVFLVACRVYNNYSSFCTVCFCQCKFLKNILEITAN